ncbi:MAG: BMP family ABC transporter substrate-binding protein [Bacilli bacterium]
MKKGLRMLGLCCLCAAAVSACVSCGETATESKFGFIFLHDENSSYDKNFIEAAKAACEKKGVTAVMKTGVEEGAACYDAAADLVDQGVKAVFADSFGHESYMIQAAKEFTNVEFCHATGVKAHTEGLDNYHNAFASIYEGRYIAGVAAGMKLNEMIANNEITASEAVMGYVGAFPYAEVVSGYTSFFLGARSVCSSVTMNVRYTNSWYSVTEEASAATALIENDNAVLISQHADSQGAPGVCESKGVPNVFYNGSNLESSPKTYLTASRINWEPYFEYMIDSVLAGTTMASDWTGTLDSGSVEVYELNSAIAASGTQAAMDTAKSNLESGKIHVFDTDTFTVGGEKITSYKADIDDAGDYQGETEVIKDGYFHESEYRSAPAFDLRIDGITEITK